MEFLKWITLEGRPYEGATLTSVDHVMRKIIPPKCGTGASSGFTQAGTVNFHSTRQQVWLMAVSPLSNDAGLKLAFFLDLDFIF